MEQSKDNLSPVNLVRRLASKTPAFWKKVRNICIAAGVAGGAIIATPIAFPALVLGAAPYLITAGAFGTFLSTLTSSDRK